MINDVLITPLNIIDVYGGNILHAMKATDKGYNGFGEAYFSKVDFGHIKAWKRHSKMTLNIVVPVGKIRFVLFDDRKGQIHEYQEIVLAQNNYSRLTVPPMIWMGFQGLHSNESILLNIANIEHHPEESETRKIEEIEFNWRDVN